MELETNKYTILVVDDVLENVKIVANILKKAGYNFDTSQSALEALRMSAKKDYDLILLDVSMPEMSGLEACRYLKAEQRTHGTPVIFLTADQTQATLENAYKAGGVDYIKKPFYSKELLIRIATHLKIKDYEHNLEKKVSQKTQEIQNTQKQLTYTLGGIAEGHSIETHLHVQRVSEVCYTLASLYGFDEDEALLVKDASSLHDVGKLGIDNRILHKEEALTQKEYAYIKKHTTIGANMLNNTELPLFKIAKIVCLQHHEKYDGTGYPNALKGDQIHIYAKIVALADVFDALLHARSYKKRWSVVKVLDYIKEMRGKHFDPLLVDLFFNNVELFMQIYDIDLQKEKENYKPENESVQNSVHEKKDSFFSRLLRKR